jgi:hydrophobe/amphiphile efflux-3 (HAE3) family protein
VSVGRIFGGIAAWSVRHARAVVAVTVLLALAGAVSALRLEADAGTSTLVDPDSPAFAATQRFHRQFGDEPVVILVKGPLDRLLLTKNLGRLLRLEGCLSGNVPKGQSPLPGPCRQIARLHPAKVVYGPATFINESIAQIDALLARSVGGAITTARLAAGQAGEKARQRGATAAGIRKAERLTGQASLQQSKGDLFQLAFRFGITAPPRLNDPQFVSQMVFDSRRPAGTPKARFAYLFPSPDAALISIRLRPELSDSQRRHAISLFREAASNDCTPNPKKDPSCFALNHGTYVVSGVPVVVQGLAGTLRSGILVLLVASLVVMGLTLALVFRPPLRLLPLAVALCAAGLSFGALSLVGGRLTMASIAVLPVLIGLAVDYSIQFQARFNEATEAGLSPEDAAPEAARRGAPVIATAMVATGAGFLVLLLSPVPMVRAFGLLLVVGVVLAFAGALSGGFAALAIAGQGSTRTPSVPSASRLRGLIVTLGRWRAAVGVRISAAGKSALAVSIASPGRVLAVAVALAVCGWVAGTRTEVVSDIRQLVPRDLRELKDVNTLQDATGVSGEVDVTVNAPDLTDPRVVTWMREFKDRVLARHGFTGEFPTCRKAQLCPSLSLPELFTNPAGQLTQQRIQALLGSVPRYFSQAVVSRDPLTGGIGSTANIAFGIRVMPLDDQKRLVDDIRSQIDPPGPGNGPPEGVTARVAGLPVLAADANSSLAGSRYWLTLAGLAAVAMALLAVYRSARRALIPLVPIALATGWSALVLAAMDIPLNPMSATLGALVIAIATEFSVILASRYREEREAGLSLGEALRRTYVRTGTAVLASGVTATAGFATLIVSDIRMLRDFGFVTVVDLTVALIGVMLVLPAVLVLSEREAAANRRLALSSVGRLAHLRTK